MAIAQDQGFPGVFLDHADSIAIIVKSGAQDLQFVPFFSHWADYPRSTAYKNFVLETFERESADSHGDSQTKFS